MDRSERSERPELESKKSDKGDKAKGALSGLKSRMGTVIGRRRQSTMPYQQSRSPERKKSTTDVRSSAFNRFSRKESHQKLETVPSPPRTTQSTSDGPSEMSENRAPQLAPISSLPSDGTNGTHLESVREDIAPALVNGHQTGGLQAPLQPTPSSFEVCYNGVDGSSD